jgi:hypothetical protein
MILRRSVSLLTLAMALGSCGSGSPSGVDDPTATMRVLFIGNSLTYANDLPYLVKTLADSAGVEKMYVETIAVPNYSLEDHWNGPDARRAIAAGRWRYVILQQGPSALAESRVLLLDYANRFAGEIRKSGARPALYMVWPSLLRSGDFDRVSESYRLAAEAVDGALFPAGEVWRAAWRHDPDLTLYSPDGLHPSATGSYAAALAIFAGIYDRSPVGLPGRLGSALVVAPAVAALLQGAAAEARERFGRP